MKQNPCSGLSQVLSRLLRSYGLVGVFASPMGGEVTLDQIEREVLEWEGAYPLNFRGQGDRYAEQLVLQRPGRVFTLESAEWFGNRDGQGAILVRMLEIDEGIRRRHVHLPAGILELVLYGSEGSASEREVSRLLVSLGLSEGIAVPDRNGFWHRLPDVRFLERNVRENGGELPLRRIDFLPDGTQAVTDPPSYRISGSTRLVFESVRWDPMRSRHLISVITLSASGQSNREELGVSEIRDRIGKISGERRRLFRHWFTGSRI